MRNCSGVGRFVVEICTTDALVEVRAAEEVAAGLADQLATAVYEAGGAGGAVDGVVFGGEIAGRSFVLGLGCVVGYAGLHRDRVTQAGLFFNAC